MSKKAEKCSKHPDYKVIRYPWSGCPECVAMYNKKWKVKLK